MRAAIIACRESVFPAYASPAEVFDGLAEVFFSDFADFLPDGGAAGST